MKILNFSYGAASFVAGMITDDIDVIFNIKLLDEKNDDPTRAEMKRLLTERHPNAVWKNVENVASVYEICRTHKMFTVNGFAWCTRHLKLEPVKQMYRMYPEATQLIGYTVEEINRKEKQQKNVSVTYEYPLIEKGLTKKDCVYMCRHKYGLDMSHYNHYDNSNCIGCIKGGKNYWKQILIDYPEVYDKFEELEQEIGHTILKGVSLKELRTVNVRPYKHKKPDCGQACKMYF